MKTRDTVSILSLAFVLLVSHLGFGQCFCPAPVTKARQTSISDGMDPNPLIDVIAPGAGDKIFHVSVLDLRGKEVVIRHFRSTDDSASWTAEVFPDVLRTAASSDPTTLYKYHGDRFARSDDAGKTWTEPKFLVDGQPLGENRGEGRQRYFARLTAIDPQAAKTIYSTFITWKSTQADAGWHENRLGTFVSTDGGDTWTLLSTKVDDILAISNTSPRKIAASQRGRLVISDDDGNTWHETPTTPGSSLGIRIEDVQFRPMSKDAMIVRTNTGYYRTMNGGKTWCQLPSLPHRSAETRSLTINPADPDEVWVGTPDSILRSKDFGCHFENVFRVDVHGNRVTGAGRPKEGQ